jgi:flagellar biosynthetic protein FliO
LSPVALAFLCVVGTTDGKAEGTKAQVPAPAAVETSPAKAPDTSPPTTAEGKPTSPAPPSWQERHPDSVPIDSGPAPRRGSFLGELAYTALMLLIVVAFIYVLSKLGLEKRNRFGKKHSGERVKVVEKIQLDQRHSLFVVEVDGESLLLGSSENGMQLLKGLSATKSFAEHINQTGEDA